MTINMRPPGGEDEVLLLTPDEFVGRAWNRGLRLEVGRSERGRLVMTDGKKRYTLPRLPHGVMPASLVSDLLYFFFGDDVADLLLSDFHLDPRADD